MAEVFALWSIFGELDLPAGVVLVAAFFAFLTVTARDAARETGTWLVEHAGFARGYRRGGAAISTRHALALVNLGGTTAELLALASEIQDGVFHRFGVRLEPEPVVLP